MDDEPRRMVPMPSKAEGWYASNLGKGFTSDPKYAKLVPVCRACDEYHEGMEGSCLL